jgi:uncharacterized SAM-binding protein YcdF (DUF218 family)
VTDEDLSTGRIATVTAFVDTGAPPSEGQQSTHVIFGTNQVEPAAIVAERYHRGLAPLVIATGGVNRHTGIIEGREFHRLLVERGVPDTAIMFEDRSVDTWQNVEFALPLLRKALESGLPITAVCKWYHRRAVHALKTLVPEIGPFHVITFDPIYGGSPVTRADWPLNPEGRRRVVREWEEVPRRIRDGSFKEASLIGGAWR